MSTSSLRLVAVGVAIIAAVLTGLVTGMVGGEVCTATSDEEAPANQNEGNVPGQQPSGNQSPGGIGPRGETRPLAESQTCEGQFSVPAAITGFLGAGIAGGAVTALLFVRRRDDNVAVGAHDGSDTAQLQQTKAERAKLIETSIYVRDRATSKALADRLGWALQEVGVATVAPTGAAFDPAHHEAGGAAATSDAGKVGTIAAVEVPGYIDRGVVLRAPVVTVYREEKK